MSVPTERHVTLLYARESYIFSATIERIERSVRHRINNTVVANVHFVYVVQTNDAILTMLHGLVVEEIALWLLVEDQMIPLLSHHDVVVGEPAIFHSVVDLDASVLFSRLTSLALLSSQDAIFTDC